MDARRRRRPGSHGRVHGGRTQLARRSLVAARRGGARDDAGSLADARSRADPERRAGGSDVVTAVRGDDGRDLEPRALRLARRARLRERPNPDHQHQRRHRGGSLLPLPTWMLPTKPVAVGFPVLGQDMDVLGANGEPVRGEVGELVCRRPWPGMTRGIWRDRTAISRPTGRAFPASGRTVTGP